jgi:outer membrane protein OmpA-like peptidoglycan-associated protein
MPEKEIYQLDKSLSIRDIPLISFRLGNAFYSLGKYEEALYHFSNYSGINNGKGRLATEVKRKTESCRFAINAIKNPVEFSPERLSDSVNSLYDDYWPSLSIDQKELVITRLVKAAGQMPQEDFFISVKSNNRWQRAQPLKEINTRYNEGAQSLSADGKLLFFTACNRPGGAGSCDIYYSVYKNGKWRAPVCAGHPLNTSSWESQPSISSDGRFLYFSSNRPGGRGGKDLWRSEFLGPESNGMLKWKDPVNLGDSINTEGDETSPFIHPGNRNFYFSSDYHTGMGGFDLFMSDIINDTAFSKPVNLGYPINTARDEKGLHISGDGLTAFYSSSADGKEDLDIFSFSLDKSVRPHPATYVFVTVIDANTLQPVQADLELINLDPKDTKRINKKTDIDGTMLLCLPVGNKYAFSVSREEYLFYSEAFDLSEIKHIYDPYELTIKLNPIKTGAEMNLYNIYFETDSFAILPESEPELMKLTEFLKNNSSLNVEIQGHTDNTGDGQKNLELSKLRANSVVEFLVNQGINRSRLQWRGYGETMPVADNETVEGRRQNRRTTIKITGR